MNRLEMVVWKYYMAGLLTTKQAEELLAAAIFDGVPVTITLADHE